MSSQEEGKGKYFQYAWHVYGVLWLLWILPTFIFGWQILLWTLSVINEPKNPENILFLASSVTLFSLPWLLTYIAYLFDRKASSHSVRWLIIYNVWTLIVFVTSFVLVTGFGGMSMAAVDNSSQWPQRYVMYVTTAAYAILYVQPFIVGLSFLGIYRLKKLEESTSVRD